MELETQLKIMTPTQFSLMIEELAAELGSGLMDTIIHYCERNNMEVESAAKLCNASVKGKIQLEAEDLNFLPKTTRLPI